MSSIDASSNENGKNAQRPPDEPQHDSESSAHAMHAAQDGNIIKDSQRPPDEPPEGNSGSPDDDADDSEPLPVLQENLPAYSMQRWCKLLCSVFGMQKCVTQAGGVLIHCCTFLISH